MKLEDRLGLNEMDFLKNFLKQRAEQNGGPTDLSRRAFLTTAGKTALGVGAGMVAAQFPFADKAFAGTEVQLPPGIAHCRDKAVIDAYRYWHMNTSVPSQNRMHPMTTTRELALAIMGFGGQANERIRSDTPYKDPAYYFLAEEMNMTNREPSYKKVEKINNPLSWFGGGIWCYFNTWIRNTDNQIDNIERSFLQSIFTAAGRSENDVQGYQKMSIEQKSNFLKGIMRDLKKASYENQLVAEWSATWLTNHYWSLYNKINDVNYKDMKMISNLIEKPLTKYVPKVRGPPYYLSKQI